MTYTKMPCFVRALGFVLGPCAYVHMYAPQGYDTCACIAELGWVCTAKDENLYVE